MSRALVSIVDGIPTTTSKLVAETFGKRHSDVLRDIERICTQVPENFRERNFASSSYEQEASFGKKASKLYLLTRDGLTLLVMGYTGKEAMRFKLAYIEAFNCMEKQLEALRAAPAIPILTIEERRPLSNLIGQWAGKAKLSFPDCWRELHAVFNISTVSELPASQLPAALAWVQARIDALDKPDFPLELANCGKRGKDHVNLWTELEDLKKKLALCNSMVFLACSSGRSMLLTSEKNLWHATLAEAVRHAQNCLEMAQQNVQTALRIKAQVDFHTI